MISITMHNIIFIHMAYYVENVKGVFRLVHTNSGTSIRRFWLHIERNWTKDLVSTHTHTHKDTDVAV